MPAGRRARSATRRPACRASGPVASDLFAFAASFVGAALRMRLTDHRGAQVVLRGAAPTIEAVTADALARSLDDLGGYAPMADICLGPPRAGRRATVHQLTVDRPRPDREGTPT